MSTFLSSSKWFSRAWIVFAYFCPGALGVLVSVLLSAGIVLGLQLAQVSVIVVVGNAVIRGIFEDYYHGQLPPSFEPIFLSPRNAAIIGAIGAPIYIVVGVVGWAIYYSTLPEDDLEDLEDSLNGADYGLARAHHRASIWPLLSLGFGIAAGAMILRFRDPAISVGYSALCGWAGVMVLLVPLALSDVLLRQLASKLGPTCAFMVDIFYTHLGKGYELWTIAGEGKVALPV